MGPEMMYRHIIVTLARAGIAAPRIAEISGTQEYSEGEVMKMASESVDYIEAAMKHRKARRI